MMMMMKETGRVFNDGVYIWISNSNSRTEQNNKQLLMKKCDFEKKTVALFIIIINGYKAPEWKQLTIHQWLDW